MMTFISFVIINTGNALISYDLTQETFLKLIKYIGTYKDKGKFKGLSSYNSDKCMQYLLY